MSSFWFPFKTTPGVPTQFKADPNFPLYMAMTFEELKPAFLELAPPQVVGHDVRPYAH